MLFLILDAWLMVVAWRKGWRWRALLPLGVMVFVAFFMGMAVGAAGGEVHKAAPLSLLLEFVTLGILIWMGTRAPESVAALKVPAAVVGAAVTVTRGDG